MSYCAIVVAAGLALNLAGCGSSGTTTSPSPATTEAPPSSATTKAPPSPATTEAPASPTTTTSWDNSSGIQLNTIQFREHPDRCIEPVDANATSGSWVRLAACDDQARHQSWLFDVNNSVIRSAVDVSKCLDISDADVEMGTFLQIWDCYFGDAQHWGYDEDPGTIYHCEDGGCNITFCVDAPQNVIGSQIEIWNCDDKIMQSWSLGPSSFPPMFVPALPPPAPVPPPTASTQIKSNTSSLCVDLPGGDASNGALLWMWECNGGDSQQWVFQQGTLVYMHDTSKCVDLLGGNSTSGNVLGLWDCLDDSDEQQWEMDSDKGTIYLASSASSDPHKCVQIGGENGGDPLVIWDCNDEQNQVWTLGSVLDVLNEFVIV